MQKDVSVSEGWQMWQGIGQLDNQKTHMVYYAADMQDDECDLTSTETDLKPGLIGAKSISGKEWQLDIKPSFFIVNDSTYKRFSFGLWFGDKKTRPSGNSKDAVLALIVQRSRGDGEAYNKFTISSPQRPEMTADIPRNATVLRFERVKNEINVYYSNTYVLKFVKLLTFQLPSKAKNARFFIAAKTEKTSAKSRLKIDYLNLNGKNFID